MVEMKSRKSTPVEVPIASSLNNTAVLIVGAGSTVVKETPRGKYSADNAASMSIFYDAV